MGRYTEKTAQRICDLWNEKIPVNTEVEYEEIIGRTGPKIVVTRSQAWALSGVAPVVMVHGIAGGVAIDHMTGWHEPKRQLVQANRIKNNQPATT